MMVVLATLSLCLIPTELRAQDFDSDGDGLSDNLENTGFTLNSGFELWDGQGTVPGSSDGGLDPNKPDLFVIVRLASPSNFDSSRIEDYFEFATNPVGSGGLGFNVWVLREASGRPPSDRQFSPAYQKAVLLIEDLDTAGTIQGIAQYASIMVPDKGIARVYSQRVVDAIDAGCAGASVCEDASGADYSSGELKFRFLQWVSIHEAMHVLFSLDNSLRNIEGHHLTRGEYVMMPAVVYTEKRGTVTYHIPGKFSTTEVDNWEFY